MDLDEHSRLEKYRTELAGHLEQWRAKNALELEAYKSELVTQQTMSRVATDFALAALRAALLINGAAAIALLTFVGHLWTGDDPARQAVAGAISDALITFGWGVVAATLAAAASYLSQILFAEIPEKKDGSRRSWPGHLVRGSAMLLALISIGAFVCGLHEAANGIGANLTATEASTEATPQTGLWKSKNLGIVGEGGPAP